MIFGVWGLWAAWGAAAALFWWLFTEGSTMETYPPHSAKAIELFQRAAAVAGVPLEWAASHALHEILRRESGGVVGRPNYLYGARAKDPRAWSTIWSELRAGKLTSDAHPPGHPQAGLKSSATGLGQLTLPNVRAYYPGGVNGIGDALAEAVGMLRYMRARHKTPDNALAAYGKAGEGW